MNLSSFSIHKKQRRLTTLNFNVLGVLFLFLLFVTPSFGQYGDEDFECVIGPELRSGKKEFINQVIGTDQNGYYAISLFHEKLTIYFFDQRMAQKKSNEVKLRFQKQSLTYVDMLEMNGEFYLFTSYIDRKNKVSYLYQQKLNKDQLVFSTPKVVGFYSYKGHSSKMAGNFYIAPSEDKRFVLVLAQLPTKTSLYETKTRFSLSVFDQSMNLQWIEKDILMNEKDRNFDLYNVQVGNDGKVYVLAKIFDTSKHYGSMDVDYIFKLEIYSADTANNPLSTQLNILGQHVPDISFKRLENGNIQIVGFFSPDGLGQNGIMSLLYSPSLALLSESSKAFPIDFMMQYDSDTEQRKAIKNEAKGINVQFKSYEIREVVENYDQTVTLIAEQYKTYVSTYTYDNGGVNVTHHYLYGDILVVKLDRQGEVEWMELIQKDQNSIDKGYYSGFSFMQLHNGNLVFVFNDHPKNSYSQQLHKFYAWSPNKNATDVVLIQITEEGRVTRDVLYKGADEEVMLRPNVCLFLGENKMVIVNESRKATKMGVISFD